MGRHTSPPTARARRPGCGARAVDAGLRPHETPFRSMSSEELWPDGDCGLIEEAIGEAIDAIQLIQAREQHEIGLFKSNDGGRSLHISSTAEHAQRDNLAQCELCGKLIGLALLHGEILPAMRFTLALRKLILGITPLTLEDMATDSGPRILRRKGTIFGTGTLQTRCSISEGAFIHLRDCNDSPSPGGIWSRF